LAHPVFCHFLGTGASCIYPLLGAKLYGWHFFATDVDKESIRVAEINVEKNLLSEHILVLPTDGKHALEVRELVGNRKNPNPNRMFEKLKEKNGALRPGETQPTGFQKLILF
jgi:ribosomal protein L11 methylase PrmA